MSWQDVGPVEISEGGVGWCYTASHRCFVTRPGRFNRIQVTTTLPDNIPMRAEYWDDGENHAVRLISNGVVYVQHDDIALR